MDNKKNTTYVVTHETNDVCDLELSFKSYSEALSKVNELYNFAKAIGIEYESVINIPLRKLIKNIHLANGERVTISIHKL